MKKRDVIEKDEFFWPIALFPYYKRSHTVTFTGKDFIKDVKFSAGCARLYLTERKLYCRLIFPPILIFEVELPNIISLSKVEDKKGILKVGFRRARLGWLTRFVLSDDPAIPRDHLFLNLGDECETWFEKLISILPSPEEDGIQH